jgi:hypothetical protein
MEVRPRRFGQIIRYQNHFGNRGRQVEAAPPSFKREFEFRKITFPDVRVCASKRRRNEMQSKIQSSGITSLFFASVTGIATATMIAAIFFTG